MQTLFFLKRRNDYVILDKINFRTKMILRDEEEYYLIILVLIYLKGTMNLNVYAPQNRALFLIYFYFYYYYVWLARALEYKKQKLVQQKEEINKCVIIVGDFNTHSAIDKTIRQKISKDIGKLNNTVN